MNYEETLHFLYASLPVFQRVGAAAYKADLGNTLRLDAYFGHPHRQFKTVHVAGTNGKGSVSHLLAAVLQQAGYRVGLYTSPHLVDFRERIRVNGEMIPRREVTDFVEKHRKAVEEVSPSFFELTVMMAFDWFARSRVDVAVIEVGMGGRLDSTNVVTPLVGVITNIGYDHMQFLGDTLEKIAAEKAGIIKPGVPVVIGESAPETAHVFVRRAEEVGSPLYFADRLYECTGSVAAGDGQRLSLRRRDDREEFRVELDLGGHYQRKNIVTVWTALEVLKERGGLTFAREDIEKGLRHAAAVTGLAGRWQVLGRDPLIVCDTGHNEAGIREVTAQLRECRYRRLYVVFGVVNDKDLSHILPLLPPDAHYLFTQAGIERALDADVLAEKAWEAGLRGEVVRGVREALATARGLAAAEDLIYVGGSTFVVADALGTENS